MKPLSILTVATVAASILLVCTSFRPVRTNVGDAVAKAKTIAVTVGAKAKFIPERVFDVTSIWRDYAFTGAAAGTNAKRDLWLFWYVDDLGTYWMFNDVSAAVMALEEEYGVLVDGNPEGTLLSGGYPFSGVPHISAASCFLYGHF